MNLSNEINLTAIAKNAGLKPDKIENFAQGLVGENEGLLILYRDEFTALQKAFEEAVVELILREPELVFEHNYPDDKRRPPFFYDTYTLATPIYNAAHPRAKIVEEMLQATSGSLAAFVCSYRGLHVITELDHVAKHNERLKSLIRPHGEIDPFSVDPMTMPPSNYRRPLTPDDSSMIMRSASGLSSVQFRASQSPTLNNRDDGAVIFGERARSAYERALISHTINQARGRSSKYIRRVLGI